MSTPITSWQTLPGASASRLADRYWLLAANEELPHGVLPTCIHSHLVFCPLDQPFCYQGGGIQSIGTGPHLLFANRLPLHVLQQGMRWRLGVRLRPTAVYRLLGRTNDADGGWAMSFSELGLPTVAIDPGPGPESMVQALDRYMAGLPVKHSRNQRCIHVEEGIDALATSGRLANALSRRSYQRAFRQILGASPSQVAQRLRANGALEKWQESPHLSGTELAHLAGYYDQSHFIHNLSRHLGQQPSQYRRFPNLLSDITGPFPLIN